MSPHWVWRIAFILSALSLSLSLIKLISGLSELSDKVCSTTAPSKAVHLSLNTSMHSNQLESQNTTNYEAMKGKLIEIESSILFHRTTSKGMVIAKDISYGRYYAQRDLQGWSMAYNNFSFEVIEQSFRTSVKISDLSVFVCLGIQSQDKHCIKPSSFRLLTQAHRYNQIHGLRDILWRKDAFCYTVREALSSYRGRRNFTFPCWVLPMDEDKLGSVMEERGGSWIVKPSGQGEGHGIFVVDSFEEIGQHKNINNFVVQPLLMDPCLVYGKKFDFRTYVLVTSVTPLRAYIYREGLVRLASSKYDHNATRGGKEHQFLTNTSIGKKYTHLANLTWTFEKLRGYFEGIGVDSDKVFESLNEAIVRTLLTSEYKFVKNFATNLGGYDCSSCFQLLGVDVIINSNYQPIVIEVNGLPSMQLSHELGVTPDPSNPYTATKYGLMHDMLQILFKTQSVVANVMEDLKVLNVGLGPGPLCSPHQHKLCIDNKDMQKLIDSKREFMNKGGFERIYPSLNGHKYSRLIHHMHDLIVKKYGTLNPPRTLWQVHHLYTAVEKLNYVNVLSANFS